jgi:ribose transport system substrate-binding protein
VILAGCGGGAKVQTFALVPKAMNNPFFDQARDGCKAAQAEHEGFECLYVGPGEHSEQEQVQIVEDLVTRRVDGIAVAPSNAPAMARAFARAREAGIPVITWDSDLLPEDRHLRATYIGTENRKLGVAQAGVLQSLAPQGGTLCIQSGGAAAQNLNERMQGIRDTLSGRDSEAPPGERLEGKRGELASGEGPRGAAMDGGAAKAAATGAATSGDAGTAGAASGAWIEVQGCPLYTNDDFMLAVQQMDDMFTRFPDLTGFLVTGGFPQFVDQAYRQAAERHRARLDSKRTIVIVADTLPMQMALLREGLSHAQVGQRPREMGYSAMLVLRDLAAGGEVEDPIHTGLDVCTQESANTCLEAHQ